jgi:CheY-like chemotaxis protein
VQVADSKPSRVLIVHNDSREASEVQALLKNLGYVTVSTWSGLEALEWLRAEHFDVLLTDSHVPDIYIGELIERASVLPSRPHILVLRSRRRLPDLSRFEALGLCAILDKQQPQGILQALAAREIMQKRFGTGSQGSADDKLEC